ncbi:MAG: hypothetical protein U0W24_10520 [Bacteroidales bacterium]
MKLAYRETIEKRTINGYTQTIKIYGLKTAKHARSKSNAQKPRATAQYKLTLTLKGIKK